MKNKILFLIFLLLATEGASAQIMFERTYGGSNNDQANCIQQTSDGGYIITGGTFSYGAGSRDIYLIKTDAYGDTLWTETYGGQNDDLAYTVKQTMDGGYIIAGSTGSFGAGHSDGYIIKTNSNGDSLWTRTIGGNQDEYIFETIENDDGSFIMAGTTCTYTSGSSAIFINKVDSNGHILWQKAYEKLIITTGGPITKKINNYHYILGSTHNETSPIYSKIYLLKINDAGDTLWTKTYEKANRSLDNGSIKISSDNNLIISGTQVYPGGEADLFLMKTDLDGNIIWFKTYGGSGYQGGGGFAQTSDNGYIITGVTGDVAKAGVPSVNNYNSIFTKNFEKSWANGDLILIKTNENGDSLWSRTYGGSGNDVGNSVQQTSDNGLIICGWKTIISNIDYFVIKTDNTGFASVPNEEKNDPEISLYPNPNKGIFHIIWDNIEGKISALEVINSTGQVIISTTITPDVPKEIDLTEFSKGIYLLYIHSEGFSVSKKIIVQ